jgi:hypothetical protein
MNAAYASLLGVVVIDASNKAIRMTENGVTQIVFLTEGVYFLRGDGTADDLCAAIKAALDSHTGGTNVYAVAVVFSTSPTGVSATVTISIASGGPNAFAILWSHANTSFDEALIGFTNVDTANSTAAKSGTLSPSCIWVSNTIYRRFEPDGTYVREVTRARSGKTRAIARTSERRDRLWIQEVVAAARMKEEANTADPTAAFNRFVARHADGKRFEWHDGALAAGTTLAALSAATRAGTFVFSKDFYPAEGQHFAVRSDGVPTYSFQGALLPYVA